MYKNSRGFTIVELLIVIVVIGILAAIVIVAFNGVQGRAQETAVRTDLRNFSTKMEEYKATSATNSYLTTATIGNLKFKASKAGYDTSQVNLLYCTYGEDYALLALTKNGKKLFINSLSSGVQEYIGGDTWLTGVYGTRCGTAGISSSANYTGGYNAGDTTTGPWRSWAGGN